MNIKSLLLGSAAALVAVSGARAADAVVIAEPEPVEYVRVCDAYGAGFFYIPGTETCLQISGYVYYQIGATSDNGVRVGPNSNTPNYWAFAPDGWNKETRARLNIDARSDTEWGTLRSYIRLQSTWGTPNDGPVAVDWATIQLGGLFMGYADSAYYSTFNGGSSYNAGTGVGGLYSVYAQYHQLGYNFSFGNGGHATIALQDDTRSGDGYMPDVIGVIGLEQGWGGVWAKLAYDEDIGGALVNTGVDGFAGTFGAQFNIPNMAGSFVRGQVFYAENANAYSPGSEWSVYGEFYYQASPTLAFSFGAQYFMDTNYAAAGSPDGFAIESYISWTPVENFNIVAMYNYDDFDGFADPSHTGLLRFTRSF